MPEINVRFPKNSDEPQVMPDPIAVVTGVPFTWAIKTEWTAVKVVGIKFSAACKCFPTDNGPQVLCEKELENGVASIWGVVPKGASRAKYTVYGKDAKGEIISELDPMILPTDPP